MGGWTEVQIITGMKRLPAHFHGQFWTPLPDQSVQEWKGIISFDFHCEFDSMPNSVEMAKKFL
jgi:hypothetical protein